MEGFWNKLKTFWNGDDKSHSGYLDALKGIAIIGVTFIHVGARSGLPGFWGAVGTSGARGVQLFFVISGLLAFVSMEHMFPERKNMKFKSVMKWYLKKYLRLFPLFYIAILISMLTQCWSTYWLGTEGHVTAKNIISHIFFVHGLFPHYTDSILGVDWYVGVLVLFFLITPLIFYLVDSLEKSILLLLIVQIAVPWINGKVGSVLPVASDPDIYNTYLGDFGPINELLVYCLGITLFFVIKKSKGIENTKNRIFLAYDLLALSVIMMYGQLYSGSQLFKLSNSMTWGVWFFVLVLSQAIYSCPVINNPLFRIFGRYSYGIYLIQFIWIGIMERHVTINSFKVKFLFSLFGMLVVSIILTKFIDQPLQKFFSSKLLRKKDSV